MLCLERKFVFISGILLITITLIRSTTLNPNSKRSPRIVSGKIADPNQFPFIVSLGDRKSGSPFCGGTILNEKTILTAAHCIVDEKDPPFSLIHLIISPTPKYTQKSPKDVIVVAGEHRVDRREGTEQFRNVVKIITHSSYRGNREAYDIAILELQKPLKFNKYVQPAQLAPKGYIGIGLGTILGWGVSTRDGKTSSVLRKARIPLIPELVCKLHYDDFRILSNICAGGSIQDTCFGDSGGPLLCGENPYTLCGVTSYGNGCGRLLRPGAYTKITYFYDWILQNMVKVTNTSNINVGSGMSTLQFNIKNKTTPATASISPESSTINALDVSVG